MKTSDKHIRFISAGLFVLIWLVYALSPVTQSSDSRWTVPGAVSLILNGDLNLDEYRDSITPAKAYSVIPQGEHLYSYFPPAATLLSVPFVAAVYYLPSPLFEFFTGAHDGVDRIDAVLRHRARVEKLIAASFAAGAAICVFLYAAALLPVLTSLCVALLFAFGTSAWSSASRAMWQHAPGLFFVSLSILLLQKDSGRCAFAAGCSSGLSYMVRPTNALAVFWGFVVSSLRRSSAVLIYATGVALSLLLLAGAHRYCLSVWLPSYFAVSRLTIHANYGEALAANLLSPSRGLFVYSPFLLLLIPSLCTILAAPKQNLEQVSCIVVIAAHVLAVSAIDTWWGGDSYGPRFMTDILPFFFVLLIDRLHRSPIGKSFVTGLTVLGVLAVCAHAPGALSARSMAWNKNLVENPGRVWSIAHPQFLHWAKSREKSRN